jgi:DNA-binding MarR family transcriptional regulator
MAKDDATTPDHAVALLLTAARRVNDAADEALERKSLSRMHHRILASVRRAPGASVSELLATLGVTKQAAHGALRELVEGKLIKSEPDEKDARSRRLTLTAKGQSTEKELSSAGLRLIEKALGADKKAARDWAKITRAIAGETAKSKE